MREQTLNTVNAVYGHCSHCEELNFKEAGSKSYRHAVAMLWECSLGWLGESKNIPKSDGERIMAVLSELTEITQSKVSRIILPQGLIEQIDYLLTELMWNYLVIWERE
jgi:hypothetical protein